MKPTHFLLCLTLLAGIPCAGLAAPPVRDVTFLSASDPHYREADHRGGCHNDLNRATVVEMNRITSLAWPEKLGGGTIAKPRGVLLLGDLIDDGDRALNGRRISEEQYRHFVADFGLDGSDGLLEYPVFEGWGNHDGPPAGKEKHGFSSQAQIKQRNLVRMERKLVSNVSQNGLHYSWDWDDVHFVQLNIYPADKQHPAVKYSPVWHDPQDSLAFLKEDLEKKVGTSGRPVVLMAHCGFDTDWWNADDWNVFYQACKPYRVVLYLYGHTGTGVGTWAPAGETKKIHWINDGHADTGFFVIQITGDRLRAAYRLKTGIKSSKSPDGRKQHEWAGQWDWKWLLDRNISE